MRSKAMHILVLLMMSLWNLKGIAQESADFYVAANGNDGWSGRLPVPNAARTDGPFKTLQRARDALRSSRQNGGKERTVMVRGGTYYLPDPLVLGPDDSGTKDRPVRYRAYPGEKPILSGGRPVAGWHKGEGSLWEARIPSAEARKWAAKQLFVEGERQIRARHPNFDPTQPTTGGFLFVRAPANWPGGFGACVGSIHNPGDFLEYEIEVPADGQYHFWLYYGADNRFPGGMADRTQITVDGGKPVWLSGLADTGGWATFVWSRSTLLPLTRGKHTLRWTNVKGGGLNLDAFALCDDPAWKPVGTAMTKPKEPYHLLMIQCERFVRSQGKQMMVGRYFDPTGKLVYFDPGALHAWPKSPEKVLHLFVYEGGLCSNTLVPVTEIDEGQCRLKTARQIADYRAEVGARFFIDNVREALDSPGEWYLDRESGTLSYWPERKDWDGGNAVLSHLDSLIELNGDQEKSTPVEYVQFEGFTLECTDYGDQKCDWYQSDHSAVWLRSARHCRFVRNRFVNLGGTALVMVGDCCDNEVVGNDVSEAGAGGFSINGNPQNIHLGSATKGRPACRNRVSGNHIHHTGLIWKHGNPVCLNSAEHNVVSHNLIHDVPRMGILATKDSGGNVIEFNELRRTSLETGDSGGIYLYAVIDQPDTNVIRNNLVVDTIGMGTTSEGNIISPHYAWGIYLDGESGNTVVRDNIVVGNVLGGVFFNGGRRNVVENNILMNGSHSQVMYSDYADRGTQNVFQRNVVVWIESTAHLFDGQARDSAHLDADYNVYWHGGRPCPELADLQKRGWDRHSLLADPRLADPAKGDYRLSADSPALKLGFRPINTSHVGPRGIAVDNR